MPTGDQYDYSQLTPQELNKVRDMLQMQSQPNTGTTGTVTSTGNTYASHAHTVTGVTPVRYPSMPSTPDGTTSEMRGESKPKKLTLQDVINGEVVKLRGN